MDVEMNLEMDVELDVEMDLAMDVEMGLEMGLETDLEMDVEMNLEMDLELDVDLPSRETYLPSREITPDDVFCKTLITHNIMSTRGPNSQRGCIDATTWPREGTLCVEDSTTGRTR